MSDIRYRSDFDVELVDLMGSDMSFVNAAKVSTLNDLVGGKVPEDGVDIERFLAFLMKNRHHSPFEQATLKFRIAAPIVVAREFFRHRIASYNEMSGRYTEMLPMFYVPNADSRPLAQVGKPGAYRYSMENNQLLERTAMSCFGVAVEECWESYQEMLRSGIAKEVARMVLPLNLYTQWYVTMNPRALMNFLSLRTNSIEGVSKVPSFPMWEIARVAAQMEDIFAKEFPVTWKVWHLNGREGA